MINSPLISLISLYVMTPVVVVPLRLMVDVSTTVDIRSFVVIKLADISEILIDVVFNTPVTLIELTSIVCASMFIADKSVKLYEPTSCDAIYAYAAQI